MPNQAEDFFATLPKQGLTQQNAYGIRPYKRLDAAISEAPTAPNYQPVIAAGEKARQAEVSGIDQNVFKPKAGMSDYEAALISAHRGNSAPIEAINSMLNHRQAVDTGYNTRMNTQLDMMKGMYGIDTQKYAQRMEGEGTRLNAETQRGDQVLRDRTIRDNEKKTDIDRNKMYVQQNAAFGAQLMDRANGLQRYLTELRKMPGDHAAEINDAATAIRDNENQLKLLMGLSLDNDAKVTGYAEGGAIEAAVNPTAMGAPADMESGGYVIPVEAVRFYGVKLLKDMVQKALIAE